MKNLPQFWTFKVFSIAVSKRVAFELRFSFEQVATLSALEVLFVTVNGRVQFEFIFSIEQLAASTLGHPAENK